MTILRRKQYKRSYFLFIVPNICQIQMFLYFVNIWGLIKYPLKGNKEYHNSWIVTFYFLFWSNKQIVCSHTISEFYEISKADSPGLGLRNWKCLVQVHSEEFSLILLFLKHFKILYHFFIIWLNVSHFFSHLQICSPLF